MPRKTYTEQFKRDAVSLYESTPGATINAIASDLGVNRNSLRTWLDAFGTGTKTNANGDKVASPIAASDSATAASGLSDAERIRVLERENAKLREEREILRKAAKYFAKGDELVNRFRFVDDHRDLYEVKRLCQVLKINRSSYYAWKSAAPARRQRLVDDAVLGAQIKTTSNAENGCYGAKRVTAAINSDPANDRGKGGRLNHKRTARLMRQMGLFGFTKKRRVKTTTSSKRAPRFPDLLQRRFTADRPNAVYVGDITYLPIADGSNMYLATVIDCYSRQLTGFAIADHMRTELVEEALTMAHGVRGSLDGAIFHSDHGSVYTSEQYRRLCERFGVTQSMGTIGTSADNSLAESFNASLKREVLQDESVFASQLACRRDVFRWCTRYNTKRLHSWCGYRSPNAFEAAGLATLTIAS
ncbi:IS3 family transposase [Corynebacterium sanguinis]|nr:IS3 family transposase [Corynebacterium sanguinis]MCT1695461.1 IS3 family transposase [Corynebacterium sanguinis]